MRFIQELMKNKNSTKKLIEKQKNELNNLLILTKILLSSNVQTDGIVPIFNLIKMISDKLLFTYLIDSPKDRVGFVEDDWRMIFNEIFRATDISSSNVTSKYVGEAFKIKLGVDPVLPFPWERTRIEENMQNKGIDENIWQENSNHWGILVMPIGLTIVQNGNHSITSGVFKSVGELSIGEKSTFKIFDLTKYYEKVSFNGVEFIYIETGEIIYKPKVKELGQLFEVGRLISKSNVNFIEYKVTKKCLPV